MALTGIAGVSAADAGTAHTQTGNHHTMQKITKTDANYLKIANKPTKTQKKVFNKFKTVKKTNNNISTTTQKVNSKLVTRESYRFYKHYRHHGKYKHYRHHGKHKKGHHFKRSVGANSASIKALAASLTRGTSSQYRKGAKVFNWVRDHISYRFYKNTRYGATGTLKYRKGNCADQAHLVVALSRSAGLQARYVHAKAHFRSGHWYGHVWAQVYANGKWYTADPTSNRNSFGVARNWNYAKIKGISNEISF